MIDGEEQNVVSDVDALADLYRPAEVHAERPGDVRVGADRKELAPVAFAGQVDFTHHQRALADRNPRGAKEGGPHSVEAELREDVRHLLCDLMARVQPRKFLFGELGEPLFHGG